jgi:DNA invertase Pin-like site-specific DNA recombinase
VGLIFAEKKSGTKLAGREELTRQIMREGDVLVVPRIDRLARSMLDFATILNDLRSGQTGLGCTEQAIDTSGPLGELRMNMLAAFAQVATQLRRQRQMEASPTASTRGPRRAKILEQGLRFGAGGHRPDTPVQ